MGSCLTKTIAVIVPVLSLAMAGWYVLTHPQESPTERLNRVCESCGVTSDEFNKLIANVQRVEIKRKDAIGLFKMSFRDRGGAEVCAACAEAIMDVVDEMSERE
jgi:hypothetical protein